MNKVILTGNLTRDPELKSTQSGKTFARVGIAVKRPFSKDAVDFFNLLAWEHSAEFLAKYFSKGSRLIVEGHMQTGSYEKDGVKHNTFDIVVNQIEFADSKKRPARDDFDGSPVSDDDTPF